MTVYQNLPEKLIQEIKEIPPLPDIVVKVLKMTRNPDVSAPELTKVISQDQALTGNILRLCNSSYYGLPRVVSSLTQAVMYLGFYTVRNLVLTCSVAHLYSSDKKIYGYTEGGLWFHAVASAMGSEILCKRIRPDIHDTAFTAGLLHDIGQIIMGIRIKDTADTIVELMTQGGMSEVEAEKEAVGFSHDELGGMIADHWNFPEELVHAIRWHHFPEKAETKSLLTAIVHISNSIVLDLGYGLELEQMKHPISPYAQKAIGMKSEDLQALREEIQVTVEENCDLFMAVE